MFSCLICDLHEFCPNPVVKPAEEVCEQSIMQFPPWLVFHSQQFVFFTFQEIQSLEWGDYAGITFFFKEKKKIYSSHDFVGNLGNICWNDLQVRKKIVYEFLQDSTAGFYLLSTGNWYTFLQNLSQDLLETRNWILALSRCIKLSAGSGIPQTYCRVLRSLVKISGGWKVLLAHFSA